MRQELQIQTSNIFEVENSRIPIVHVHVIWPTNYISSQQKIAITDSGLIKQTAETLLNSSSTLHTCPYFSPNHFQDIQLEEHQLENENKLLNLESKRNELEYKKRLYPAADHSNDEMTVKQLEKYLVRIRAISVTA